MVLLSWRGCLNPPTPHVPPLLPLPSHPLPPLRLSTQDFPYYFEPDVTHWLLWNNTPLDKEEIWEQIRVKFPEQQWEALMFVNPAALQSILSVRGQGLVCVCVWGGGAGQGEGGNCA